MFLEFVYVESFLENVVSAIQAFNKYLLSSFELLVHTDGKALWEYR